MQRIRTEFGQPEINLTLGVVKDGQVLLKKHYGYANPQTRTPFSDQTRLYLASTSKSLTGTLAAILDKKGLVKLNKTLADYLPELVFEDKQLHPEQISVQSLLTHTHGIKNNDAVIWTAFIGHQGNAHIPALLRQYSSALPDTRFNYSNLGPVLYSLIVEKQTGQPWPQVMGCAALPASGYEGHHQLRLPGRLSASSATSSTKCRANSWPCSTKPITPWLPPAAT
jgi:CubicO group peptidase (beta-lactamase class C family)